MGQRQAAAHFLEVLVWFTFAVLVSGVEWSGEQQTAAMGHADARIVVRLRLDHLVSFRTFVLVTRLFAR